MVSLTPHQRSVFLYKMETVMEVHNWSQCSEQLTMGYPSPMIDLQYGSGNMGEGGIVKARGPDACCRTVPSGYERKTAFMKSQQHGCPNDMLNKRYLDSRDI